MVRSESPDRVELKSYEQYVTYKTLFEAFPIEPLLFVKFMVYICPSLWLTKISIALKSSKLKTVKNIFTSK